MRRFHWGWIKAQSWAAAVGVLAVALPMGASASDKAGGCTNRMPAPGALARGSQTRIPNHCRCGGRTLTIIAGGNMGRHSKSAQGGGARRQLICN